MSKDNNRYSPSNMAFKIIDKLSFFQSQKVNSYQIKKIKNVTINNTKKVIVSIYLATQLYGPTTQQDYKSDLKYF